MTKREARRATAHNANGLHDLIETAEELLESLQDQQGAAVQALREKVSATLEVAQRRLQLLEPEIRAAASDAMDSAVSFVRRDPWRAVAIGALAGLAITMLMRGGEAD
jgi:ElaB/YqjD/DUF883 family membrane-anchored ribosome-binding protein